MLCPNCKKQTMEKAMLLSVEIDYCTKCFGVWFDNDELRWAKDKQDKNLNWLDIDLWRDKRKFEISRGKKMCPHCRMPLYEIEYDKSKVRVDLCNLCKGIWLEKNEFKEIISYLKEKADYEVLYNFSRNFVKEAWEIFAGPETMREEILDLITLLKLFYYKFSIQHPNLEIIIKKFVPTP